MAADELDELLRNRLARDSVKDAVAHAVELSGRPRREIYARALELAKETRCGRRRWPRLMTAEPTDAETPRKPPRPSGSRRFAPAFPPKPAPRPF